jgi:lipopolysaccharide transport system permease protein
MSGIASTAARTAGSTTPPPGPSVGRPRAPGTPTVTYAQPERSIRRSVGDAWRSRHLLPPFSLNVVSRMYTRTYLGRAWIFLRPALDALGGALLFGAVLRVTSQDGTPYLLFFTAGILGWRVFERTVLWVTRSFDRLGRIVRRVEIPLLLVPLAGSSPALVDLAAYLIVLVLMVLGYVVLEGEMWLQLGPETLIGVAGLALCIVFGLAIGLWTSVVNAHARDIRHVLRYVLQIWMFITPVIYPVTRLPSDLQPLAQANPMAAPIAMVKRGLLGSGEIELLPTVWSVTFIGLSLLAGLWFFSRRASNFMGPAGWEADDEDEP